MSSNDTIKIGLMGCGHVATYGHLPAIMDTPALKLNAIFEPNPERLRATQEQFQVPHAFTDAEAFLASDIEAVTITSPAPVHLHNVLAAAEHRKPVLCEKPLAMSEGESLRMIEAMQRAGQPLFVGFTYRFSPTAMQIRELVQRRAIGEVRSLRLIYLWACHGKYCVSGDPASGSNFRRDGRMVEGGPMVDCGVHQIDLARWWLGSEVTRQQAVGIWVDEYDAPDHMYMHLDHANGAHTMVEMSYSYGHTIAQTRPQFKYELIGTEGLILFDRESHLFELRNSAGVQTLPYHGEKNFHGMYAAFADAIRTGQPGPLATAQDGLIATRIATAGVAQVMKNRTK